ncbi:hypothetical protein B4098_1956 [Heyndrickxia coagulans]|uniref:Uncharacterized protein n=1 Tax=Heyndrickxia coagulans TaxID=1398 RepID=A0A150JWD3_HEYCO|nr:hypothetical protein B4098_1956 [Heyndrickxia coagulans]
MDKTCYYENGPGSTIRLSSGKFACDAFFLKSSHLCASYPAAAGT